MNQPAYLLTKHYASGDGSFGHLSKVSKSKI